MTHVLVDLSDRSLSNFEVSGKSPIQALQSHKVFITRLTQNLRFQCVHYRESVLAIPISPLTETRARHQCFSVRSSLHVDRDT